MSDGIQLHEVARAAVLCDLPDEDAVRVRRDIPFATVDGDALAMDVYSPAGANGGAHTPVVIIVSGYPDLGVRRIIGCRLKEMASVACWARLLAASGVAAIAYENRDPARDLDALLAYVEQNAAQIGVDSSTIGVWASSGNGPLALSLLARDDCASIRWAVLCYPYTLDLDDETDVADASQAFGFVNACAGKSVENIRRAAPIFLARAGRDGTPGLNETLDRFVARALACNLPITVANHADGPHAFDLFDDSHETRAIIDQIMTFVRSRRVHRDARKR